MKMVVSESLEYEYLFPFDDENDYHSCQLGDKDNRIHTEQHLLDGCEVAEVFGVEVEVCSD